MNTLTKIKAEACMLNMTNFLTKIILLVFAFTITVSSTIAAEDRKAIEYYQIQPGDVLQISVWKEESMTQPVVVRPDGQITFPLIGEATAAGNTIEALRRLISERLVKFIPDPVVTISIRQLSGNTIYVIGKVNRPGVFPIVRNVDVMQALSLAGGTSTYASVNDIKILRREKGELKATPFKYGEIEKGKHLEQNIILKAGDVIVVP